MLKRKTPLKAKTGLSCKKVSLKKTILKTKSISLKKTELKKYNDKAREKWEEVRKKVMERDKGVCQICGKPGTQVHHIHLRSKRKDLVYEMNNLIVLCDKHHFHEAMENYFEQTELIAHSKNISVEELLKFAETKSEE